ncbi:hypothetical protein KSP39_PZI010222 [Platanthera zijinensis]|uniref:PHD finger family protein n=1 Tax=Platanthera zijinensis TaxID=2320716 RepID=A0AAP0BIX1_9ASPA
MSGGRSKRRKTTGAAAAEGGSSVSEKPVSPSRTSGDGLMAAPSVAPGLDLYAQARKALTERCPFDSEETAPRFGTLPSALAVNFHKKSDGRRKHRKVQEGAEGKSVGPGRPPPAFSVWEKTEEYFRPITLDDIDLLFTRLPPDSCFYLPGSENLVEEVVKGESVLDETAPGEVFVASSSVVIEEGLENVGPETVQPMHVDEVVGCSTSFPAEDPETDDQKSLNWILGCKQRFLLTSGQISRKKKLFGKDAGLEPLLLLPRTEAAEDGAPPCDFCCSGLSDMKSNVLLVCDSCKVSVHQKCYGVHEVPDGGWLCSWCKYLEAVGREMERNLDEDSSFRPCLLCPQTSGALKPVVGNFKGSEESKFVHLFCSLWTPGMYVENVGVMEPVIQNLQEPQRRLTCNLCKIKHGISVRCSHEKCRTALHPICARAAKYQMEIWGKFGHDNVELRVFCLKHSSLHNIDSTASAELPSRISKDEMVQNLLPASVPIRRLPKIKITSKSKDNSMVRDGNFGSLSDEGMNSDANLNKQMLVLELGTSGGDAQSNKTQGVVVPDNENVLRSTSDVITVLRKIIDRRKISIGDVALELGVSLASLESSMMGEGASLPSELRLKIIQWLQNFAHVQPPTCHLKSRNGDVISSSSLIARVSRPSASTFNGRIDQDSSEFREVADIPLVKSQPSCSNKNNSHDLMHDSTFYSSGDAFDQDNSNLKFVNEVGVPSDCINAMVTDNDGIVSGNIEDHHLTELNVADMTSENVTGFLNSAVCEELLYEDKDNLGGGDLEGVSNSSLLDVENNQLFDASISEPKTDMLERPDFVTSLVDNLNNKDIGLPSRSYIQPFILKKLGELQNQWSLHQKQRNMEAYSNDKLSITDTKTIDSCLCNAAKMDKLENWTNCAILDQLEKAKNMKILDASPTDEVEGELLYLQKCLLDRVTSIKHSCEELIYRITNHLPQELDAFRKKRWDMVLIDQYLCEVKEAKKRGRKERRHTEAQAVLAAATAAAAASRTSVLRKDAIDGISSSQQNPLKNTSAARRVTIHSPVPRPKETVSRSFVTKASSDKHSGEFKFPDFAKENALFCDVCWRTETIVNRIFVCSSCKVAVHLDCYRRLKDPTGPWRCELCEDSSFQCTSPKNLQLGHSEKTYSKALCSLCGGSSGAFRKSIDGEWVHAFCAEWLLESTYKRGQLNLVGGMETISKDKDMNTCCICHNSLGLCLKCSYGHCQSKFHPSCARNAGLFLNIKASGGRLQHKAYCEKHSLEQREKADSQHGADELRSIKQVRVDLEKLRLLCERVIKREKLKRDVVVYSHGILASRRDCVAFSAMVHSSLTPGISSESATTSIDNPSYSGAVQRSDDITINSTVHGRNISRLQIDVDRKTDDSSMSQLPNKRKMANRITISGKQLPQRPPARVSNIAGCGEMKSKDRKGMKSLEKEMVMTSYQASLQNQRLPKGFVYVPVGSLQKDASATAHDSESCELPEPGG